jgi:hypothetical protein
MKYYIVYPSYYKGNVIIHNRKPIYRWSDGAYTSIEAVKKQLDKMNIPKSQRPEKFR